MAPLDFGAVALLVQPRAEFAFFVAALHWLLVFGLRSALAPGSLLRALLPGGVSPVQCLCLAFKDNFFKKNYISKFL